MSAPDNRTVVRIGGVLLLLLLVVPFVITGVPALIGAQESYVVLSASMADEPEPVIRPGDVVIVDSVDASNIEEGDIITYQTGSDKPTTHRVVDIKQQDGQRVFTTKGDNNENVDPQPVTPDQVIGRVMLTIPLIGYVVNFANTPTGFALLVGGPIALLVLSEAWTLARDRDTDSAPASEESSHSWNPLGSVLAGNDTSTETGGEPTDPLGPTTTTAEAADGGSVEETASEPETVTLGRSELRKGLFVLVPLSAALGVVGFRLQTAWILTLFYAGVGLTLLAGVIYVRMDEDDGDTAEQSPGHDTGRGREPTAGQRAATAAAPSGAERANGRPQPRTANADGGHTAVGAAGVGGAPPQSGPASGQSTSRTDDRIVTGRIADRLDSSDRVAVDVDGLEPLIEMAAERNTRVIHDTETGIYHLIDDETVFRFQSDQGAEHEASGAADTPQPGPSGPEEQAGGTPHGSPHGADDESSSPADGADDNNSGATAQETAPEPATATENESPDSADREVPGLDAADPPADDEPVREETAAEIAGIDTTDDATAAADDATDTQSESSDADEASEAADSDHDPGESDPEDHTEGEA